MKMLNNSQENNISFVSVSYTSIIHKAQGLTHRKFAIDIGPNEITLGPTYVALNRVKKLEDLLILKTYTKNGFDKMYLKPFHKLRQKFMNKWYN